MTAELVVWKDAVSEDEWKHKDSITPHFHTIKTVGWLISESDNVVTLGLNHDETEGNFSCIMHIPIEMIVLRKSIKLPKTKKPL